MVCQLSAPWFKEVWRVQISSEMAQGTKPLLVLACLLLCLAAQVCVGAPWWPQRPDSILIIFTH